MERLLFNARRELVSIISFTFKFQSPPNFSTISKKENDVLHFTEFLRIVIAFYNFSRENKTFPPADKTSPSPAKFNLNT